MLFTDLDAENSGSGVDPLVMVIIPRNSQALANVKDELDPGKMNQIFLTLIILTKYTYRLHIYTSFADSDEPLDLSIKKSDASIILDHNGEST